MNNPSNLLYNYRALVMDVNSVDKVTALVDHGFRSWSMRQFKLAGVMPPDPRSKPPGQDRNSVREALELRRTFLEALLKPEGQKVHVLIASEKPAYSGTFSAGMFMPCNRDDSIYCVKHAGKSYLSICTLMRHLSSGDLGLLAAQKVLEAVGPYPFKR